MVSFGLKLHDVYVYKFLRAVFNPSKHLIYHFCHHLQSRSVAIHFKITVDLLDLPALLCYSW